MARKELYMNAQEYLNSIVPPRRHNSLIKDCVSPCVNLEMLGQVATGKNTNHGIYFHIVRMLDAEMIAIA